MEFANKSHLVLEKIAAPVTLTAAASAVYSTGSGERAKLGDLSRLSYVKAKGIGVLTLEGATGGDVTVKFKQGTTELGSATIALTGATRHAFEVNLEVSGVNGYDNIYLELDVDNVATQNGSIASVIEVEHPIVIGGGCG